MSDEALPNSEIRKFRIVQMAPEAEPKGPSPRPSPSGRRRKMLVEEVVHVVTKPEHPMCRPFRAWESVCDGPQGVALGCRMVPRGGGRRGLIWLSGEQRRKRS